MRTVVYPGSFDPVTVGHEDIIRRAADLFDRVVVGILHNAQKPGGAFAVDERAALLETVLEDAENVEVRTFSGLLTEAVRAWGADGVVRGIRTGQEMEPEMEMARINRQLSGVETVFLAASPGLVHISASRVREIGRLGGDLSGLVPEAVRGRVSRALL